MSDKNESISEKAEKIARKSKVGGSRVEVPLYERRRGKEFHASGSWQATKGEQRLIETFGCMFFFGVFIKGVSLKMGRSPVYWTL